MNIVAQAGLGTSIYELPPAIELDPNISLTRELLWGWLDAAAKASYHAWPESLAERCVNLALVSARTEGRPELGCILAILPQLDRAGQLPLALRALVQIAIDAGVAPGA